MISPDNTTNSAKSNLDNLTINKGRKFAAKSAYFCARAGVVFVICLTVLGGLNFPNYNHLTQFISELGARNAPNEYLARYAGFLPAGILICLFTVFALYSLPKSKVTTLGFLGLFYYATGYIVAAFFPCDFGCRPAEPSLSQLIHNFIGGTGYLTGVLGLIALSTQARHWTGGKALAILALSLGIIALIAVLLTTPTFAFAGLTQRIIELSLLSWIVYCGYYLHKSYTTKY